MAAHDVLKIERVAAYIRLSRDDEDSTSVERQQEAITAYCKMKGWPEPEFFIDNDVSGFKDIERPEHTRLMKRADDFDVIIVWKLDRWGRNVKRFLGDMEEMNEAGVAFVSIMENIDMTSPYGELIATLLMAMAQMESKNTSVRRAGAAHSILLSGGWGGGPRPFGWKSAKNPHGKGKVLKLHPDEAPILKDAIDKMLKGDSYQDICEDWARRGITGPQGGTIDGSTLSVMLRHPRLAGYQTRCERDSKGRVIDRDVIVIDPMTTQPVMGPEPLIDIDTWKRLQTTIDDRFTRHSRAQRRDSLLGGGFVKCFHCDGRLHFHYRENTRGTDADYSSYTCSNGSKPGDICPGNSINRTQLDEWVLSILFDYFTPEHREQARERIMSNRKENDAELRAAHGQLDHAKRQKEALTQERDNADATSSYWRDLNEQIRQWSDRIDQVHAEVRKLHTDTPALMVLDGEFSREEWDAKPLEAQREVLRTLLDVVIVKKSDGGKRGFQSKVDPDRLVGITFKL